MYDYPYKPVKVVAKQVKLLKKRRKLFLEHGQTPCDYDDVWCILCHHLYDQGPIIENFMPSVEDAEPWKKALELSGGPDSLDENEPVVEPEVHEPEEDPEPEQPLNQDGNGLPQPWANDADIPGIRTHQAMIRARTDADGRLIDFLVFLDIEMNGNIRGFQSDNQGNIFHFN